MEVIGVAKEIEQLGYEHYMNLADSTPVREISGIFKLLAREEKNHFDIFAAIEKTGVFPPVEESELVEYAEKVFQSISDHFKTAGVPAIDHDDAFEKALEFENKSIRFYSEIISGKEFANESNKAVLLYIIDQERMHARLVASLMEFFRHPGEWLENAEWRQVDDF